MFTAWQTFNGLSQFILSQVEFNVQVNITGKLTKKEKPVIFFGYKPNKLNSGVLKMNILV